MKIDSLMAEQNNISKEEIEKARKQRSSWLVASATAKLTKLCAPKCLHLQQPQLTSQELSCMDSCIDKLHMTTLRTYEFFTEFEHTQEQQRINRLE